MSKVRGSGREYQTATAQEQLRGATPRSRSGWDSLEETPSVRGQGQQQEEFSHVQGQGWRPGGDTPCPNPEARGGGWYELPHAPKP